MIRADCRHFVGSKPCKHKRTCDGCSHFDAIAERILVIKLGALGDLLRTTPVLESLKARYPRSQVTWLTRSDCVPLLQNLHEIDRLWITDTNATARVMAEEFDLLINFDKDTPAVELASLARAREKRGFVLSASGALHSANAASAYALRLGIDDELKFRRNSKTYQQIAHEMAELPVHGAGPNYLIRLSTQEQAFGMDWLKGELHQPEVQRILGVNAGAGRVFATKKWHGERYAEVAARLHREHGVIPMLLGSSDEIELNNRMHALLRKEGVPVLRPGEELSLRQFMSMVRLCHGFVTGDTLGMHIALGLGVPTVVVFTSTCAQEIELYGRATAIVGQAACAPCYLSKCKQATQHCADAIRTDDVYQALVDRMLGWAMGGGSTAAYKDASRA